MLTERELIDLHIEYKIGDVVTISKEPHLKCLAGWISPMDKYLGQKAVILCKMEKIPYDLTRTYSSYRIGIGSLHPLPFFWTSGCFEYEDAGKTPCIEPPSNSDVLEFIDISNE